MSQDLEEDVHWVLVEGPHISEADFISRWLQAVVTADNLLPTVYSQDPSFRPKIKRLEMIYEMGFALCAMVFIGMWFEERNSFPLDLSAQPWGERFAIMADIGFFQQTGDRYQMTIPKDLKIQAIKNAALKVASTEEFDLNLHPEWVTTATTEEIALEWKARLDKLPWQHRVADRNALLE